MAEYDAAYYKAIRNRILDAGKRKAAADLAKQKLEELRKVPPKVEPSDDTPEKLVAPFDVIWASVPPMRPVARHVLRIVCCAYGMKYQDLVGPKRTHEHVMARTEVAVALDYLCYSTMDTGRILKRDHSSVIHLLHHKRALNAREQWFSRLTVEDERLLGRLSNPALGYKGFVEGSPGPLPGDAIQESAGDLERMGTGVQPWLYGEAAE